MRLYEPLSKKFLQNYVIASILLLLLALTINAANAGNLKYDVAVERIVISCSDHKPPQVKLLNPASGTVVVVDCEREK